jgi:hypothetical protein
MKRFFALLLACWVLCLSVCADEIIDDPASAPDSPSIEDSSPDPVPAPDLVPFPDPVPVPDPVPAPDEVIDDAPIETPAPVIPPVDPVVDLPVPSFTFDEVLSALPEGFGCPDVVSEDVVLTGVSRVSIPPVTPSSTSGLKAALLTVLGNYDPVVVVYQYNTSSSGYSSYATDIQPDYAWLASAALLCLVIWCLFKLGGALLRG